MKSNSPIVNTLQSRIFDYVHAQSRWQHIFQCVLVLYYTEDVINVMNFVMEYILSWQMNFRCGPSILECWTVTDIVYKLKKTVGTLNICELWSNTCYLRLITTRRTCNYPVDQGLRHEPAVMLQIVCRWDFSTSISCSKCSQSFFCVFM